jgi:glycosyltransferase involved in cell wall biosynthesis
LLYVGRFTHEKNIFLLLDLIVQLPDYFCLTLAGFGYLEKDLREYAYQKLGLSQSRVIFILNPDKSVLCELYKDADLFVFSSITEGNPVVFAEAMACGTPIIALKGAWHSEQLVDGKNGFWVDDLAQMHERVLVICSDEKLFKNLQRSSWLMGRNFCAQTVVEKLENVYYQVLGQKIR